MKFVLLAVLLGFTSLSRASTLPLSTTYVVNLSWQAPNSSPDPVAGYFIYRALAGGYSELNSSPITGTSYTDTSLLYGVSYKYYATSVDAEGTQSDPSNTVTVPIPFVPYTPVVGTIQGS